MIPGVMDDEGGDDTLGQQFVATTESARTVARPPRQVPLERMTRITRLVEELEFFVRDARVSPEVLRQRLREARRALAGSSRWPFAGDGHDSYEGLVARLEAVGSEIGESGLHGPWQPRSWWVALVVGLGVGYVAGAR